MIPVLLDRGTVPLLPDMTTDAQYRLMIFYRRPVSTVSDMPTIVQLYLLCEQIPHLEARTGMYQ